MQINVLERAPRAVYSIFESIGSPGPIEYQGFRVSRNSFFQVNRFLVDGLVECAVAGQQGDSALDLYAGVGLFAKALAGGFHQVTAIESGHSAFRDLVHNIGDRVSSRNTTVEEYLAGFKGRPDLILADPPRAGLTKHVVADLTRIQAACLVIVACDPATLARDLQGLIAGGYRIHKITLVDLFPQTFHLESVVELRR